MADVKIESKNQSGGITAQNVNTGNSNQIENTENQTTEQEGSTKKLFWWVFGIVGLVAAIATIYTTTS